MKIGIPKEITPGECRVAAVPETVAKMIKAGMEVFVESDAGSLAYLNDSDYIKAGAKIVDAATLFNQSDTILKVNRPLFDDKSAMHEIDLLRDHSTLIAPLFPSRDPDLITKLRDKKITAFALELLPRIARAQSMDILSSMSNLAGYKSVILAADYLGKIFPMMTTAAGTVIPAKVIVIGAGVAGLQAIATARRLGGVVIAFDTRPVVGEQVKSLGADFVSLETHHEEAQDSSGYAKEQSAEFYQKEQDIIKKYINEADVVITTALIPGKAAPLLITEEMVNEMRPGSVIVDLGIEQGGNCALTEPGKVIVKQGVTIIGLLNLPSTMPIHASQLYSKNLFAFLNYIAPQMEKNELDRTDDIVKGCLITFQGDIVHPALQQQR